MDDSRTGELSVRSASFGSHWTRPIFGRGLLRSAALACGVLWIACGADDGPAKAVDASLCTAPLALDCSPAFPPTYPMLYDNLFVKTCGAPGTGAACHSAAGAQGGLVLANVDTAYDMLLGTNGGRARVLPGDPECSILVERIESSDPAFRMPLNSDMPLSDGLRCAIRQWIQNGATRQ